MKTLVKTLLIILIITFITITITGQEKANNQNNLSSNEGEWFTDLGFSIWYYDEDEDSVSDINFSLAFLGCVSDNFLLGPSLYASIIRIGANDGKYAALGSYIIGATGRLFLDDKNLEGSYLKFGFGLAYSKFLHEDYNGDLESKLGVGYNFSYGYSFPINKGKSAVSPEIGAYYNGSEIEATYGHSSYYYNYSYNYKVKKSNWNLVTMINFIF